MTLTPDARSLLLLLKETVPSEDAAWIDCRALRLVSRELKYTVDLVRSCHSGEVVHDIRRPRI